MKLSVIGVVAVIGLRLGLFFAGIPPVGTQFMLVHFLCIVTIVFFVGHGMLNRDLRTSFPHLMREGFKSAAVYALFYGIFILIYYKTVEPAYFADRVDAMVARGVEQGQPESVIRPRMEQFFTPFNYASMTFFALLAVGGFNALAVGLLHHKLLRRIKR